MAWYLVAEGKTSEELQQGVPQVDLAKGTRMKLEIVTKYPIGYFFDLWGAEWVVTRLFPEIEDYGAEVVDVEGVGAYKIVVHMRATGTWVPIIVAGIIAAIVYFGWRWFQEIRLFAEEAKPLAWALVAIIGAAVAIPLISLFRRTKEKVQGG